MLYESNEEWLRTFFHLLIGTKRLIFVKFLIYGLLLGAFTAYSFVRVNNFKSMFCKYVINRFLRFASHWGNIKFKINLHL